MKKFVALFLVILTITLLFSSCQNEPEVIADPEIDTTIVFTDDASIEILVDDLSRLFTNESGVVREEDKIHLYGDMLYYLTLSNGRYSIIRRNLTTEEEMVIFTEYKPLIITGFIVVDDENLLISIYYPPEKAQTEFGRSVFYEYNINDKLLISYNEKHGLQSYDIYFAKYFEGTLYFIRYLSDVRALEMDLCMIDENGSFSILHENTDYKMYSYTVNDGNLIYTQKNMVYLFNKNMSAPLSIIELTGSFNPTFYYDSKTLYFSFSMTSYYKITGFDIDKNGYKALSDINGPDEAIFAKDGYYAVDNVYDEEEYEYILYKEISVTFYDYSGNVIYNYLPFDVEYPVNKVPFIVYKGDLYYLNVGDNSIRLQMMNPESTAD